MMFSLKYYKIMGVHIPPALVTSPALDSAATLSHYVSTLDFGTS